MYCQLTQLCSLNKDFIIIIIIIIIITCFLNIQASLHSCQLQFRKGRRSSKWNQRYQQTGCLMYLTITAGYLLIRKELPWKGRQSERQRRMEKKFLKVTLYDENTDFIILYIYLSIAASFFQNIKMRPKYNNKCYNHWFFCRKSCNCNWQ